MPTIDNARIGGATGTVSFQSGTPATPPPAIVLTDTTAPGVTLGTGDAAQPLRFVLKAGDTMTGLLSLSGPPTSNLHAASKLYVDASVAAGVGGGGTTYLAKAGDTMTGLLLLSGDPSTGLGAATKAYVDGKVSGAGAPYLALLGGTMSGAITLAGDPLAALQPTTKQYVDTALALRLLKSGGTLTGPLILSGPPGSALEAATKQYVDASAGGGAFLPLAGGTMLGLVLLSGAPTLPLHAATKAYVDASAGGGAFLPLAGGTMTGLVVLSGVPTLPLHAATKAYVDVAGGAFLALAGGTMTGDVVLSRDPTLPLHAATKEYVDAAGGGTGNVKRFSFTVTFVGTDPATFSAVPAGWTVTTPSTGIVHVVHNVGGYPCNMTGCGLTTTANTWRQALFGGNALNFTYNDTIITAFDINGVSTTTMNAGGLTSHIHVFF